MSIYSFIYQFTVLKDDIKRNIVMSSVLVTKRNQEIKEKRREKKRMKKEEIIIKIKNNDIRKIQ